MILEFINVRCLLSCGLSTFTEASRDVGIKLHSCSLCTASDPNVGVAAVPMATKLEISEAVI